MGEEDSLYSAPSTAHPLLEEALGGLVEGPRPRHIGQQHIASPEEVVPVCDQVCVCIILAVQMPLVVGVDVVVVHPVACMQISHTEMPFMTRNLLCHKLQELLPAS